VANAGILQQSTVLPRRFLTGIVVSIDAAVLVLLALFGPIGGAMAIAALTAMLYSVFSPIGFVLLLTVISPFYSLPGLDDYTIHAAKWIATIFVLVLTILQLTTKRNGVGIRIGPVQRSFIMFAGWGAICSLLSVHPLDGLTELLRLSAFLLVSEIAAVTIDRRKYITMISVSVLISVAAASLYSFAGLWLEGFQRVRGFFGNANAFGQFLAFTLPILVLGFVIHRRSVARLMFGTGIVLGAVAVLLSWSRAAILCLTVQWITYLIIEKKKKMLLTLVVATLLVAASVSISPSTQTLVSTVLRLQTGTTHRTTLWKTGLKAFQESPVVGLGLGAQKTDVLGRVMWNDLASFTLFSEMDTPYSPHNVYIYMLMTTGLPGLILFLFLYRSMIRDQWRSRLAANVASQRKLHSIMISVLVGTLAHGFFETGSIFSYGSMANYFWITLGMAEAIKRKNLLVEETERP
jgi:O-antigen ligase